MIVTDMPPNNRKMYTYLFRVTLENDEYKRHLTKWLQANIAHHSFRCSHDERKWNCIANHSKTNNDLFYGFVDASDAMAFKLRWS